MFSRQLFEQDAFHHLCFLTCTDSELAEIRLLFLPSVMHLLQKYSLCQFAYGLNGRINLETLSGVSWRKTNDSTVINTDHVLPVSKYFSGSFCVDGGL